MKGKLLNDNYMSETCLLCNVRKVNYINSHFTPAGITKNTFGERGKEHIFTIDAEEKIIDEYFGRNHQQQENSVINKQPNARKGIFCIECEECFGNYEAAVQYNLNEIINSIGRGAKVKRTETNIKYVDINNIHPNVLITYFLSIIWRQCLEQTLDGKDNPLNPEQYQKLRDLVLKYIELPVKVMKKKESIISPVISIFTSYNTKLSESYANPHNKYTNPLIFFIGPVVLLYWVTEQPTSKFE